MQWLTEIQDRLNLRNDVPVTVTWTQWSGFQACSTADNSQDAMEFHCNAEKDIARLIAAVRVAEKALRDTITNCETCDGFGTYFEVSLHEKTEVKCGMCAAAREAVEQLQNGKFVEGGAVDGTL